MPDIKEKPAELMEKFLLRHFAEEIAEHLIANGATIQEWISVEERSPHNNTYINVVTDGVVAQAYWHNDRFYAVTAIGVAVVGGVTHWMPLPTPPKGE